MTEGVLIQKLLKQNDIEDCAMVLFDEFHERSLQSDLALALSIQCQEYLRDDLKLLIMSATLDNKELEEKLGANSLISKGRSYPIDIEYRPVSSSQHQYFSKQVYQAIKHALQQQQGDILVFLPGIKEISQTENEFDDLEKQELDVLPLHGSLNGKAQQAVIKPSSKRKIILATDIAKTSLTIEGITVVIDSGLERLAQFNAKTQMNELITVKASQASCIQRTGRAGRLQAGHCYRLFSEDDFKGRSAFTTKAIESEDLAQFSLSLAAWGSLDLNDYFLLDQPNSQRWSNSLELLQQLNALEHCDSQSLTEHGILISKLPLHPRLSHMLVAAKNLEPDKAGIAFIACYVAAILSEGDPLIFDEPNSDLEARLHLFEASSIPRSFMHGQVKKHLAERIQTLAKRLSGMLKIQTTQINSGYAGILVMLAYPDRIAQKRGKGYRLSQGLGCQLLDNDALDQNSNIKDPFLSVAHVSSMKRNAGTQTIIRLAANLHIDDLYEFNNHLIETKNTVSKNEQGKLINIEQTCLGKLVLKEKQTSASQDQFFEYWFTNLKEKGLSELKLTEKDQITLQRLQLAHSLFPDEYLNFSESELIAQLDDWLMPFVQPAKFNENNLNFSQMLLNRLDWSLQQQLDKDLPLSFELPSDRNCKIDYSQNPPIASAKLQEFFGLAQSPTLARGRLTLNLHLLSPAQRPLAQTSDLAFFWENAYPDVRKENRGRYAKHPWPEDPLTAIASSKTKNAINRK